jgi:lipopolysaccharide/colanic/teichoic acid biosynthesis glycosyltransferase
VLPAPVLAACAIAIKLDSPGPVLFRHRRVGRHDRPFEVFKFRSMYVDAYSRKDEVARLNFHGGGNDVGVFKVREDPRITRVGCFLRRYSLDELPQLFNILRGEMSFVGPRPLIKTEDRQIEGRFRRRLSLTPGLWQAHGRTDIPFAQMVNLDHLYMTNWSLWGDVKLRDEDGLRSRPRQRRLLIQSFEFHTPGAQTGKNWGADPSARSELRSYGRCN